VDLTLIVVIILSRIHVSATIHAAGRSNTQRARTSGSRLAFGGSKIANASNKSAPL
jgi:hypothetical protein